MASTISTDIFDIYRGTEEQITNLQSTPIKDGNVYFAYDKDDTIPTNEIVSSKLYFDANSHRFVVAGGGDISFIKAHPDEDPIENEDYLYEFNARDIDAHKINIDNILITNDNILYRVVAISEDGQTIYTQKIVGGGGGGGNENPLSITWVTDFPARLIDTRVPSATVRLNSRNATIDRGILSVYCNDVEVTELANPTQTIKKTNVNIQIPLKYLNNGTNRIDVKIDAAGYSFTANGAVTMFHAEFAPTNAWNPRRIFGTDETSVDVQKIIAFPYTFTGLSDGVTDKLVSGTIQVLLDGEVVKTNSQLYGEGTIAINCLDDLFANVTHGNHLLSYHAYAVVNEQMYEVTTYNYDIIWATEAGGSKPIIISPYADNAEEENYNIINIPYLVYQKDTEESQLHLYVNGEELPTSPITVKYDKTASDYLYWTITKYISDQTQQPNVFIMRVENVQREFNVTILPSQLNLDADNSDDLLLYLSAQDRSNKESVASRKTWSFKNYSANLEGFNWYNNGWQEVTLEESEINKILATSDMTREDVNKLRTTVLRLSNGAKVTIPFNGILQETQPQPGFTIEVEFKCRNAINYSKLLQLTSYIDTDGKEKVRKDIIYNDKGDVANAVGMYFKNNIGFAFGTQEAFFRSSGKTVNVRYADNDKVKVSVVADDATKFLYIYINGVLSGVERYDVNTSFQANADALVFNSDYCDLDLYSIRIYKKSLSFDGIVQNWVGEAPDLPTKLSRYEENNITRTFTVNGTQYVTLDYEKTRALSQTLADRYIAAGRPEGMVKGMPIMVITTYGQDELPYNKANKKYAGLRFWDPNGEVPVVPESKKFDAQGNEVRWYGFKARNFEFSVQGTSSQGYPRRNFKAKIKDAKDKSPYQAQYPFEFTTWDGNETYKDTWSANTAAFADAGYEKIKKIDIGNGTEETKFCFKADFMDSSSSHNTPLADYIQILYSNGTGYDLRHPLSLLGANDEGVSYRTTVYGFPMLLFREKKNSNEPIEFVGKYNFNTDKSATDSFGFTIEKQHRILGEQLMVLPTGETDSTGKVLLDGNCRPLAEERYPTYADVCECWELTSNQHGFTGFRRNDFDTVIQGKNHPELDFYNFWENRYSIWDFGDPAADDDVYSDDTDPNKTNAIQTLKFYMRNIRALSEWIYSTDVHPWDTDDETNINHHKLTQMTNASTMHYTIDENDNVKLLRDYYTLINATTVSKVPESWFSITWDNEQHTAHTLIVHNPAAAEDINISLNTLYEDEINAVLSTPIKYLTRDLSWDAEILTLEEINQNNLDVAELRRDGDLYIKVNKTYYLSQDTDSGIPIDWYHIVEDKIDTQKVDENNNPVYVKEYQEDGITVKTETINQNEALTRVVQLTDSNNVKLWIYEYRDENNNLIQGTTTDINQAKVEDGEPVPATYEEPIPVMTQIVQSREIAVIRPKDVNDPSSQAIEINIGSVYELFTRDTKNYRLSKFRAEFRKHLNLDYCAAYFVLTELMIMYDSREKNMMIATWGPEEQGGEYIWYPIFYDMDTQLGINNSGTVYWDYDVNAQNDGIFSGAGSVLWDNFYACFLPEIKAQYINWRNNTLTYANCIKYYNTNSADTWTPIMKNTDAFYKYIAPAITGLGFVDQDGVTGKITDAYFYCTQGDRSLNRAAFFRNRFNYKDSEWLGGTYRTQGGANIEMRYDANWTGTSDPDASTWANDSAAQTARRNAGLDATAHFDITPYLTQYTSVYYDELPRSGGRYDIQNPPADGYVRVTPLESIQQTIDNGLPLSQQLVYIYGPAYLRDIGDLSTKYLDRLTLAAAVRLNRLILGNDDPLYRNDGATSESIKIESPYRDASGVLNPNAKSLLEYLDLSNLANMRGSLDMSGCLKLKTIRALGSSLTAISLPEGNVVSTLYLPNTNEDIVLIQSQKLNTIIYNRADCITSTAPDNTPIEGLYIENITDKMDVSANNNVIVNYMANTPITIPNDFVKNNIKKYQLDSGVLGFQSYEILDHIVKSKIIMNQNPEAGDKLTVMMRLLNVDWSPYHLLDETAERISGMVYYIRNTDNTYSVLDTDVTFDYARKNLGGIYTYDENMTLRYGDNAVKHGLPDLNILQLFVRDYKDGSKTNLNGQYLFRDIFESNNNKYLPHIGGEIYIDNEVSNTISEYDLYTLQEAYNSVLSPNDVKMTICAKNVASCPRAQFIEVVNGVQIERGLYRSNNPSAWVFTNSASIIKDCARTHYDFRGWVSKADAIAYDSNFMDSNGIPLSDSIVEKDSAILEHLVDLTQLRFGQEPTTYYAVFTLHEYKITYVLNVDAYELSPGDAQYSEIKFVPSGSYLTVNPCSIIPWKQTEEQPLFSMWVFKGWSYKNETNPRDLSKIRAQNDIVFYPVFEEDSVYNNPLKDGDIDYVIAYNGNAYIRGFNKHLGGKVTIPKYVETTHPVVSILGSDWSNSNTGDYWTTVTDIPGTNEHTNPYSNGIQDNLDITHLFFEGSNDNTSTIRELGRYSCYGADYLVYIDMPSTLNSFSQSCCYKCRRLSFASLSYAINIGRSAFSQCNVPKSEADPTVPNETLSITATSGLTIDERAFNQSGWKYITIGSNAQPWNATELPKYLTGRHVFDLARNQQIANPVGGLNKITVYSSVLTDNYFHTNPNALLPEPVDENFDREIIFVG